jgi:hypothetical protein
MTATLQDVDIAWNNLESAYRDAKKAVTAFSAEAGLIGAQLIQDVPTRMEYMKLIRAEADAALAGARSGRTTAMQAWDYINGRRDELRLIQQDKAKATVNMLSKLITKHTTKHQHLINTADALAREGLLPAVKVGDKIKAVPLEKLSPEQFDEVLLKAIDRAGGSRKAITPANMRLRGAGLLILSAVLAGVDIYLAQDKSFATTKNASSLAAGAGGAWAGTVVGFMVGNVVGAVIGFLVGSVAGSHAGEEAHYAVRGLHSHPRVDGLVSRYYGTFAFDEQGLGYALHTEFLGDLGLVLVAFSNLNEKRNADADDVATAYVEAAMRVCRRSPDGALADGLRTPVGQALTKLLQSILDDGWTTDAERAQMMWLASIKS